VIIFQEKKRLNVLENMILLAFTKDVDDEVRNEY
jgi:hypothetical protein